MLALERAPRRPSFPAWAILVGGLWLALVGLREVIHPAPSPEHGACLFRTVTGVPCATCGTTRAVLAAAHGEAVDAFLSNPLMTTLLAGAAIVLLVRVAFARRIVVDRTARRPMLITLAVAAVANWLYVVAVS